MARITTSSSRLRSGALPLVGLCPSLRTANFVTIDAVYSIFSRLLALFVQSGGLGNCTFYIFPGAILSMSCRGLILQVTRYLRRRLNELLQWCTDSRRTNHVLRTF